MERAERAVELYRKGLNCSQAVAVVFADAMNIDEATILKLSAGFGGGMGTGRGVCGALSGAATAAGAIALNTAGGDPVQSKLKATAAAGAVQKRFAEDAKAVICREIKTGSNGAAFTSCEDCIRYAVRAAETVLRLEK